jgi:tetratricopeptide (TPR) repeat protein
MKRGWKIALGCLGVCILALVLALWGLWAALGRGAVVYRALGDMEMSSRNEKRAAAYYERALKRRPNDPTLHLKRGDALAEAGKKAAAIKEYQQAAKLDPESTDALVAEARLHREAEDFEAAQTALEQARERDPSSRLVHLESARMLTAQYQHQEAIGEFEEALDHGAEPRQVCFELGQAYEKTEQREAALKAYRRGARDCDTRCRERLAELGERPEEKVTATEAPYSIPSETEGEAMEAAGAVFMLVFMVAYIGFIGLMMLFTFASWVAAALAIWDCSRRDFPHPNTRAVWCILIFMTRWLGALIYYIVIYRSNDPPMQGTVRPPTGSRL